MFHIGDLQRHFPSQLLQVQLYRWQLKCRRDMDGWLVLSHFTSFSNNLHICKFTSAVSMATDKGYQLPGLFQNVKKWKRVHIFVRFQYQFSTYRVNTIHSYHIAWQSLELAVVCSTPPPVMASRSLYWCPASHNQMGICLLTIKALMVVISGTLCPLICSRIAMHTC